MTLRTNIDISKYPHTIRNVSPGIIIVSLPRSFEVLRDFGFDAMYRKNEHLYLIQHEGITYRSEFAADAGTGMDIRFIEHIEGL